ncbi:MAG: thioredoxin [Candidatus Aenigmarchaeota archaeon]|nr:thioredoxin [Candidatus Aenigmarchaeota archaeon]
MGLVHLTDENFDGEVMQSEIPVIVDFWATWCPPCKMLAPVFEALAGEYEGKVKFAKLDTDEARAVAQKYSIMSIPTLIVFKSGKEVERMVGALPKEALKEKIDALL